MEKNKKNVIIITVIIAIAVGSYFIGSMTRHHKKAPDNVRGMNTEKLFAKLDEDIAPVGPPNIVGQFIAADSDQVIIEKVVGEMEDVDKKEAQSKMQALSDGGRQQMRDARRAQRESAEKEKVFVTITSETIIMQSTDTNELKKINVQDLSVDKSVMIWKADGKAIFILQNNIMRNNNS